MDLCLTEKKSHEIGKAPVGMMGQTVFQKFVAK